MLAAQEQFWVLAALRALLPQASVAVPPANLPLPAQLPRESVKTSPSKSADPVVQTASSIRRRRRRAALLVRPAGQTLQPAKSPEYALAWNRLLQTCRPHNRSEPA